MYSALFRRSSALRIPLPLLRHRAATAPRFVVRSNSSSPSGKDELFERTFKPPKDWTAPKLSYEQVKARTLEPSPDAYIVDVREPDEVIQGSIPSSVNLPLSDIEKSFHLSPEAFKEKFGFTKPRKDQEVVFYCRSGKRSATASDIAQRNGYNKIFNYEGSWLDWSGREKSGQS